MGGPLPRTATLALRRKASFGLCRHRNRPRDAHPHRIELFASCGDDPYKLLLSNTMGGEGHGPLKFVAIEESAARCDGRRTGRTGGYKGKKMRGIYFEEVDELTIEGESSDSFSTARPSARGWAT